MSDRRRKSATRIERNGIASLELVMSFPILMFLIAMLYTVYIASMMKAQLTMEVRHEAWMLRSTPNKGKKQAPFGLLSSAQSGEARKELKRTVAVYRNWYPKVPRTVQWGNVLLVGSWDHRQAKFKEGNLIYPHLDVLGQMVRAQGGPKSSTNDVNALGQLHGFPGL